MDVPFIYFYTGLTLRAAKKTFLQFIYSPLIYFIIFVAYKSNS